MTWSTSSSGSNQAADGAPRAGARWRRVQAFVRDHGVHSPWQRSVADVAIGVYLLTVFPAATRASGALAIGCVVGALLLLSLRARSVLRPAWRIMPTVAGIVRAWYPFALVPLLYMMVPALHDGIHGGRFFDDAVLRWEQLLFGGQPSRELARVAPTMFVSEPLHAAYLSYYVLVWAPALWFYLRERTGAFRDATAAFVLASLACFIVFVHFPVQGPRYLIPAPTAGGIDQGVLYGLTHAILEAGSSRGAAFPSGHVAVAAAQAIVVWRHAGARAGAAVWLLSLLLAAGAVYGGFHYAIDAVAGVVVGIIVGVSLRRTRGMRRKTAGPC